MQDKPLGVSAFSALVSELAGKRLAQVRYAEIPHEHGMPTWRRFDHDSLDFGVELGTTGGDLYSVSWDRRGGLETGLAVWRGNLEQEVLAGAFWTVSDDASWPAALGQPISGARVYWSLVAGREGAHVASPSCIGLRFRGGLEVFLAYGEFSDADGSCINEDHISVFFSEPLARRYRVGPFDPARIIPGVQQGTEGL